MQHIEEILSNIPTKYKRLIINGIFITPIKDIKIIKGDMVDYHIECPFPEDVWASLETSEKRIYTVLMTYFNIIFGRDECKWFRNITTKKDIVRGMMQSGYYIKLEEERINTQTLDDKINNARETRPYIIAKLYIVAPKIGKQL